MNIQGNINAIIGTLASLKLDTERNKENWKNQYYSRILKLHCWQHYSFVVTNLQKAFANSWNKFLGNILALSHQEHVNFLCIHMKNVNNLIIFVNILISICQNKRKNWFFCFILSFLVRLKIGTISC